VRGGAPSLPRHCRARHRAPRLAFEHPRHSARDARASVSLAFMLARRIGVGGTTTGARLGPSSPRWTKSNARTPGLGEADGNRLLRRARPMFAAADLADLLAHEFARLRRWRFSGAPGLAGFLDRSFLRHDRSPCCRFQHEICASSSHASLVVGAFHLIAHTTNAPPRPIDPYGWKVPMPHDAGMGSALAALRGNEGASRGVFAPMVLTGRPLLDLLVRGTRDRLREIFGRLRALDGDASA
jgi:hypothetical protein